MTPSRNKHSIIVATLIVAWVVVLCLPARAEDGYRLWLRYERLPDAEVELYRDAIRSVVVQGDSPTLDAVRTEIQNGLTGLLGEETSVSTELKKINSLLIGTPTSSPLIRWAHLNKDLAAVGDEGFVIRSTSVGGKRVLVVAANKDVGALYGTFHLLRLLQTGAPLAKLNVVQKPRIGLRMLNHWDNLDRSVERGYAGHSLWNWDELPARVDPRLIDYARANASIGINATSLNNVNANSIFLTAEYLKKVAAIADTFRPYGIRVLLSARFSAPMELGGLKTADPLDPAVAKWWKDKADEIYKVIPDFGGFLVKANSEGQPGPRTYGRDHVDGANMMAAAVAPHKGIVIWRAFIYDMKPGYDRAGAAYENLKPFDGKFASNVMLQVKNGPIDFQPREPIHPLFGAMPRTNIVPEFQITQEYLGFSNHLVFLADMWREVLEKDTFAKGKGSTVARVVDGSLFGQKLTGIAGVANTGTDRNWTGHDMLQSNWYAFGRIAWDHSISSAQIAEEWTKMTLTRDPKGVEIVKRILLTSHDAVVNYMTPLGLHHQMWGGHHYGPAPWWNTYSRDDWNPTYYNKAGTDGIGFDRTSKGSGTVNQYFPTVRDEYSNLATCPDAFLLWFHHLPWDYRMRSGRSLWEELALRYQSGVDWVRSARADWKKLEGIIDGDRHAAVSRKLKIQERDAVWWKDASLSYFATLSQMELPKGVEKPQRTLAEYKEIDLLDDIARGNGTFDEKHN